MRRDRPRSWVYRRGNRDLPGSGRAMLPHHRYSVTSETGQRSRQQRRRLRAGVFCASRISSRCSLPRRSVGRRSARFKREREFRASATTVAKSGLVVAKQNQRTSLIADERSRLERDRLPRWLPRAFPAAYRELPWLPQEQGARVTKTSHARAMMRQDIGGHR